MEDHSNKPGPITSRWRWLGLACLILGLLAAGLLTFEHLAGVGLPGCGPESACAKAAASVWGTIPGLDWPVSFIGLAYFTAMLAAQVRLGGSTTPVLRAVARLGALASAGYAVVMIAGSYGCPYCAAVHVANIGLWISIERATRIDTTQKATKAGGVSLALTVFIIVSAVLGFVDQAAQQEAAKRAEAQRVESTQRIIDRGQNAKRNNNATPNGNPQHPAFTGRYRTGPDPAPIRLVLFTDYQCPDCAKVESEVSAVLASRDDVSVSIKHFPFCPDCNKYLARNMHPNACRAALAAEAAGVLGGDKAFFAMHHWLFARHGMFTDQQLDEGAASLGLDPAALREKMANPALLANIKADVEEGVTLGLHLTPMVFVNGVEFRGWQTQGALTRMIEDVAASNPPALGPDADNPASAYEKFMEDWRQQPVRRMPPDGHPRAIGRKDASARVVVFGDYADQFTAGVDRNLRAAVAAGVDLRYTFRHFPLDQSINPVAIATVHEGVGLAHRAAEAAGLLGGERAYWAMHTWLMANQGKVDAGALSAVAEQLGLSADAFTAALSSPEVRNAVIEDARAAQRLDINAIPMIFVNGKRVPRWRLEGHHVLQDIIKEAMDRE